MIENLGPSNILSRILNILSVVFPLLIVIVLIVMGRNNRDSCFIVRTGFQFFLPEVLSFHNLFLFVREYLYPL